MYEQGLDQTRPIKSSQVTLAHLHKFLSSESSGFWHSDLNSLVWLDAARFDSRPTWKFFFFYYYSRPEFQKRNCAEEVCVRSVVL
jgi:hypothetical protein